MAVQYPQSFDWARETPPLPLSAFLRAPDDIGVYELGFMVKGRFELKYIGRAKGVTLRQRLGQHYSHSHNDQVRANRSKLFFRCKVFASEELTAYVEAVSIAAFREELWNKRNEWTQHWALET
jgi:hypothetical protein